MNAHTPGPWTVQHYTRDEGFEVTAPSRAGMIPVAEFDTGFTEELDAEQLANAKLIAAAPELLAALTEMKAAVAHAVIFNGAGCDRDYIEAEKKAIAAITKATV